MGTRIHFFKYSTPFSSTQRPPKAELILVPSSNVNQFPKMVQDCRDEEPSHESAKESESCASSHMLLLHALWLGAALAAYFVVSPMWLHKPGPPVLKLESGVKVTGANPETLNGFYHQRDNAAEPPKKWQHAPEQWFE